MLPTLNRSAVIVTPKQPFLDWLRRVDPTSADITMEELKSEPTLYLLPDCEDDEHMVAHVRKASARIFEDQLDGWYRDETTWPTDRSFGAFRRWFDYQAHTLMLDLCGTPLRRE